MSNEQQHGVFYVGNLVAVKVTERNGYQNGDLVLIRDGATETDKIAFKPGGDVQTAAEAIVVGSQVVVQVIPSRRATSKAGNVYVRPPFAVAVEQSA